MRLPIFILLLSFTFLAASSQTLVATPDHEHEIVRQTTDNQVLYADTLTVPNNSFQIFHFSVKGVIGSDTVKGREMIQLKNTNGVYTIPLHIGYDFKGPGNWSITVINNIPILRFIGQQGKKITWIAHIKRQSV